MNKAPEVLTESYDKWVASKPLPLTHKVRRQWKKVKKKREQEDLVTLSGLPDLCE